MTLLIVILSLLPLVWGYGCESGSNGDEELQCVDGETTLCISRDEACSLPSTNCRNSPSEELTYADSLWPPSSYAHGFDFDDSTTHSSAAVNKVREKNVQIQCRFPNYFAGFKATIYHRELRTWPGEPHPIPYRPYGLVKIIPFCTDVENAFSQGVGYFVPSGIEGRFEEYLNSVDDSDFKIVTDRVKCSKGVISGIRVRYFDNEKAWRRAFGLRFFSEGVVDIEAYCQELDQIEIDEINGEKLPLERAMNVRGVDAISRIEPNETIGGFTVARNWMGSPKYSNYQNLFRNSQFWSWTEDQHCIIGERVCGLVVTMNELVGIYKLKVRCCPTNRSGISPVFQFSPPPSTIPPTTTPTPATICQCPASESSVHQSCFSCKSRMRPPFK